MFGTIKPPEALSGFADVEQGGLGQFLNIILKVLIVVGSIYALLNFILAGYGFLSAGGDPKKIQDAWAKIWQSVLGLVVMAGSFVLAAIFGWLIFDDPTVILQPTIPTL